MLFNLKILIMKHLINRSDRYFSPHCWQTSGMWMVLLVAFVAGFGTGCHQDSPRLSIDHDKTAPGPVTHVQVENLPGAAKLTYFLPGDSDLLQVEADYEIRPGVTQQMTKSLYGNSMVLEGFRDTGLHAVDLYAVDRSGNKSSVVKVMVSPHTAPVIQVYDSITYASNFGGIVVNFSNPSLANVVIAVMVKDSTGEWVDYDKDYTSQADGPYIVNGLPAVPTTFGVYVQDRWGNYSDTLIRQVTPLFETELDKTKFKQFPLPGDCSNLWEGQHNPGQLWDDNSNVSYGWSGTTTFSFPKTITFYLGGKALLSRMATWGVHDGREYSASNVNEFELWGSNDPNPDGSYDASWTLIGRFQVQKPSGLPLGQLSDEDIATATGPGDQFIMPPDAPAFSYVRFKIISTFSTPANSPAGAAWLMEITLWGQPQP